MHAATLQNLRSQSTMIRRRSLELRAGSRCLRGTPLALRWRQLACMWRALCGVGVIHIFLSLCTHPHHPYRF
jgi:hypothetical protein